MHCSNIIEEMPDVHHMDLDLDLPGAVEIGIHNSDNQENLSVHIPYLNHGLQHHF